MSEFHRQQPFGPPTFIDLPASGSSSGFDQYDGLGAANLYNESPNYRALPHPLQIPQEGYASGQAAYSSHSDASLRGLQFTSPAMTALPAPQQYEHDHFNFEELNGFSPITTHHNIPTYHAPYPDSNASATSSATSPDPTTAGLMSDPVIVEADEDKRKRNQAASARFRQKKKQREQQLQEAAREMQERTKKLESENEGLKKENQFLKKLLVEKVDHMTSEDREMLKKVTSEALKNL